MIPCYKEHDTSFIWYYYAYDISKCILDLDPDLCQNFLFFVTSSILHIETCMMPLSKAVHKGFISFFLHLRALSYLWGRYDPKTKKNLTFLLVTVPFLHIESSVIPPLKAFYQGLHFFFLHWWAMNNIWGHYDLKAWQFDDLTVLCAVWFTLSVLRDLFLKPWADQLLLTFKVNVKVKLESFNCCLQQ